MKDFNRIYVHEKQMDAHSSYLLFPFKGRYDVICPPCNAYDLCKLWPSSELRFISNAGHFTSELPIANALKEALDQMKSRLAE